MQHGFTSRETAILAPNAREKLKSHELRLICLSSAGVFRKVTGLTVVTESGCLEFFFYDFPQVHKDGRTVL